MGLFNVFKGQLAQVIQWADPRPGDLWYRFPSSLDEIKDGSKLIVAPGQGALLVYEGKVAEVLTEAGSFQLKTDNHPFFTTLVRLRQGFESEHKLQIYFFRTTQIVNIPWGTATPILIVDPIYKVPVELGVHGVYAFRVADPSHFFTQFIGAGVANYEVRALQSVIVERAYQQIASILHAHQYPITEIDGRLPEISRELQSTMSPILSELGIELTDVRITGTHYDEATSQRIARVADITAESLAASEAGISYEEMQRLEALRDAARNEGGIGAAGLQMGLGLELGKKLTQTMNGEEPAPATPAPEAPQVKTEDLGSDDPLLRRLTQLKLLLSEGVITQEDYDKKKQELLDQL